MTDRHIFDDHSTLVLRSLAGLVRAHPNLSILPTTKTVINADQYVPSLPCPLLSFSTHSLLYFEFALTVLFLSCDSDSSKVSLICGGGAGHEPGSTGFVGRGLLSASVSGDTFASPSARQVYRGIQAVPSTEGTILIITNCEYCFVHPLSLYYVRVCAESAQVHILSDAIVWN